jgi:hypothetical protein
VNSAALEEMDPVFDLSGRWMVSVAKIQFHNSLSNEQTKKAGGAQQGTRRLQRLSTSLVVVDLGS